MSKTNASINFEQKGIGEVLADDRLRVPINQRSYAWQEEHVQVLFRDFAEALGKGDYFLGTILLTQGLDTESPEVTDGQQRLATTTILLAAIRDYVLSIGDSSRAESIEKDFLAKKELRSDETVPRLKLNVDDDDYFRKRILSRPNCPDREIVASKRSHELIDAAAKRALEHVQWIVGDLRASARIGRLVDWVEFVRTEATVILVRVPDHINAFTMFETLNDRGLRIAQSDLLKNYLFDKAETDVRAVHPKWAEMIGTLEAVSEEDITVDYIRHYWITKHGPTRERELSAKIKEAVTSRQRAVDLASALSDSSHEYAALLNPHHEKWNAYGNSTRRHIATINKHLRIEQIRPLLFAVAMKFPIDEARKAYRMFVAWSVRFLIVGGRGGLLDRNYALRAQDVGTGKVKTAIDLFEAMIDILPSDAAFGPAFATARISQNFLARYYLRALELFVKEDAEPELIPNEDEEAINLEHVLPENPDAGWSVDQQTATAIYKMLGNMVLLKADVNAKIGNAPFKEKKAYYKKSGFVLTKMVADQKVWTAREINERQRNLALNAVQTWPLTY